ncbi:hypothetical protein EsDP_00004801 [Epichloe bromicola]|uniref:F-box domain-containing protein n=1 Tax=Epichloe bromicola TaxID=79588 RepID=A0ABQ0CSR8_9HYPO
MVQVLVNRVALCSSGSSSSGHEQSDGYHSQDAGAMSRDEHAQRIKELNMKCSMMRAPRRGWSLSDYQGQSHGHHGQSDDYYHPYYMSQVDRQASIPENAVLQPTTSRPDSPASSIMSSASSSSTVGPMAQIPRRRPKMPPPRRSHSVTDKEPEPSHQPRLSAHMNLLDLPSELHYALFDFLDPIDGACLGLAHSRLYSIHRRKNGSVPLCSRYPGPNDLEWAWRGAGSLVRGQRCSLVPPSRNKDLDKLRVKGQVYCRKCGIYRCELHRHLRDWMGTKHEYCEIRKVYGPRADEAAKPYCFMSSPKNPHRCGRHGGSGSGSGSGVGKRD